MNTVVKILSKIAEVGFWILSVSMIVASVMVGIENDLVNGKLVNGIFEGDMNIQGLQIELESLAKLPTSQVKAVLITTFIFSAIVGVCFAMIFRNIYLIFKNVDKGTPFTEDNVRMIREIGIFSIGAPVLQIIASIVIGLIAKNNIEVSVNMIEIMFGFVALALSRIFTYGVSLEKDVDGLV